MHRCHVREGVQLSSHYVARIITIEKVHRCNMRKDVQMSCERRCADFISQHGKDHHGKEGVQMWCERRCADIMWDNTQRWEYIHKPHLHTFSTAARIVIHNKAAADFAAMKIKTQKKNPQITFAPTVSTAAKTVVHSTRQQLLLQSVAMKTKTRKKKN